MTPPENVRFVLDHLKKVRRSGNGWSAACPAHDDKSNSLSVGIGEKGDTLLNCHAGCDIKDIVGAAGLQLTDLFKEKPRQKNETIIYDYTDEDGELLFQVVKKYENGRKDFRQRAPDGIGGWIWTTTKVRKPLFHLPLIKKAVDQKKTIWVVEGEKDVENLQKRGFFATCNPGGAGKWLPEHTDTLRGAKEVVVCVDNDMAGYKHGVNVAEALEEAGVNVRVVAPPEDINDASDAIEAGLAPESFPAINLVQKLADHDPVAALAAEIKDLSTGQKDLDKFVNQIKMVAERHMVEESPDTFGRLVDWPKFLAEPTEDYDWVIPNLLERGERVVVVAAEGAGKSMLARQVAILTSMGVHPFTKTNIQPRTTLYLDLENPEKVIRRTAKGIYTAARDLQPYAQPNAHLLVKPDGLDLLDKVDRSEVERLVATVMPDIIFIGPIYKAYIEKPNKTIGAVITEVVRYLDYLRDTFGAALWLEHHAPLGGSENRVLRPVDSGVWSRWPEFGIALRPDPTDPNGNAYNVEHFRGGRDQRQWPRQLVKGGAFPWTAEF